MKKQYEIPVAEFEVIEVCEDMLKKSKDIVLPTIKFGEDKPEV